MDKIILLLIFFVSIVAQANDIENIYSQTIKDCAKENFNLMESLDKLDQAINEHVQKIGPDKTQDLFYDKSKIGEIFAFFGTRFISENANYKGQQACGNHYDKFINYYKKNNPNKSAQQFRFWESCLTSDFKEQIPITAQKIIDCYNLRSPSSKKSK